jgi:hypothetical protein
MSISQTLALTAVDLTPTGETIPAGRLAEGAPVETGDTPRFNIAKGKLEFVKTARYDSADPRDHFVESDKDTLSLAGAGFASLTAARAYFNDYSGKVVRSLSQRVLPLSIRKILQEDRGLPGAAATGTTVGIPRGRYEVDRPINCSTGGDGLTPITSGTARSGTTVTIQLATGASSVDNFYSDKRIYFTGGTGAGKSSLIGAYTGSTRVAALTTPLDVPLDETTIYTINDTRPEQVRIKGAGKESTTILPAPGYDGPCFICVNPHLYPEFVVPGSFPNTFGVKLFGFVGEALTISDTFCSRLSQYGPMDRMCFGFYYTATNEFTDPRGFLQVGGRLSNSVAADFTAPIVVHAYKVGDNLRLQFDVYRDGALVIEALRDFSVSMTSRNFFYFERRTNLIRVAVNGEFADDISFTGDGATLDQKFYEEIAIGAMSAQWPEVSGSVASAPGVYEGVTFSIVNSRWSTDFVPPVPDSVGTWPRGVYDVLVVDADDVEAPYVRCSSIVGKSWIRYRRVDIIHDTFFSAQGLTTYNFSQHFYTEGTHNATYRDIDIWGGYDGFYLTRNSFGALFQNCDINLCGRFGIARLSNSIFTLLKRTNIKNCGGGLISVDADVVATSCWIEGSKFFGALFKGYPPTQATLSGVGFGGENNSSIYGALILDVNAFDVRSCGFILPHGGKSIVIKSLISGAVEFCQFGSYPRQIGVAQAGTANTITLAADASPVATGDVIRVNPLAYPTGMEALRVIAYDSATKIATLERNWTVAPGAGTPYQVDEFHVTFGDSADTGAKLHFRGNIDHALSRTGFAAISRPSSWADDESRLDFGIKGDSLPVSDDTEIVKGSVDATKRGRFDADTNVPAGTLVTMQFPAVGGQIVSTEGNQQINGNKTHNGFNSYYVNGTIRVSAIRR